MIRDRYPGIEFEKGWRDEIFDSLSPEQPNILVLDDQMGVASSSTSVVISHLILQKGGALPIVVPLLATVLGSLVEEFISRILRKND